ncbi:sugar phosphate isomerase/epimerase family protein [Aureibacillus halotolerans]|uniref:Hexulose-6-phosphate isomerase n=1 Tax=Aureibacillus halotolerans TaxID=1508390 RepID=A0A4R6U465_9BACI|nr:sugar phosphate isomerase/epimerase family protein [Aureibacillus halotolerans]TDQ41240.1 hexulose-6-phosphate isomerase [Aureibacillus halotolerans]
MLKALNQWCFPEGTPLSKVFSMTANAGFDAIELNLYESGGEGLTIDTTVGEAQAIKSMADANGLTLRSLSTGMLWSYPIVSEDRDIREKGQQIVMKQIELAAELGMDTVLVVPGAVTAHMAYDQCYFKSQEALQPLLRHAEEHNIFLGIENVWNKFLLSPLEAARYVDELDSPKAAFYFDVGNVLQFGFPEQWIEILGHRIAKVHVKDFKTAVGNINGFVPLLAGDVNWHAVMKALKKIGYDDVLTAEIPAHTFSSRTLPEDTLRHMDAILQSVEEEEVK